METSVFFFGLDPKELFGTPGALPKCFSASRPFTGPRSKTVPWAKKERGWGSIIGGYTDPKKNWRGSWTSTQNTELSEFCKEINAKIIVRSCQMNSHMDVFPKNAHPYASACPEYKPAHPPPKNGRKPQTRCCRVDVFGGTFSVEPTFS